VPAVRDGRIVKEAFPNGMPKQFSGLVFNTRRPLFTDIRVREALGLLLDFEWLNHNFFFDQYQRSASYFEGSELSARGRPAERPRPPADGPAGLPAAVRLLRVGRPEPDRSACRTGLRVRSIVRRQHARPADR